jgi:hypothetical protein
MTDTENTKLTATTTLKITVGKTRTVTGIVKDGNGNPIPNAHVYFQNKNKTSRYSSYRSAYTDSKGAYSISVADGTYDVVAYDNSNNVRGYLYSKKISSTKSGLDITLPVYGITLYSSNTKVDITNFTTWVSSTGETYYASDGKLCLKAGTYTLTSTYTASYNGTTLATYTAKISKLTVKKGTEKVTAKVTGKDYVGSITANSSKSVTLKANQAYTYYKFTPSTSGTYYFYSQSKSADVYGRVLTYNNGYWSYSSGYAAYTFVSGGYYHDFKISYYCEKGKTYYIAVQNDSSSSSASGVTLRVSTTNPSEVSIDSTGTSGIDDVGITDEILTPDASVTEKAIITPDETN